MGGLYKLSPLYPHDQDALNDLSSPSEVMTFKDISTIRTSDVEVINPAFDYIDPDLIDLFITNVPVVPTQSGAGGGFGTSSIYRLISEYYSMEDTVLWVVCVIVILNMYSRVVVEYICCVHVEGV